MHMVEFRGGDGHVAFISAPMPKRKEDAWKLLEQLRNCVGAVNSSIPLFRVDL